MDCFQMWKARELFSVFLHEIHRMATYIILQAFHRCVGPRVEVSVFSLSRKDGSISLRFVT